MTEKDKEIQDLRLEIAKLKKQTAADRNRDIYEKAIITYGKESQVRMVFEEMAELQKELCKNLRGEDNFWEIAEEIADVSIMLEQMILLYSISWEVDVKKRYKIDRLEQRLKKEADE